MTDLRTELAQWRGHRVVLLGAGNAEAGDDGFGVRLARALAARREGVDEDGGSLSSIDGGTCPERYVGEAVRAGAEVLALADAVDFGGAPGALLLASAADLQVHPVLAAAHRVPLSVLAQYAEGLGARAFVLGVQPASLEGTELSPPVAETLEALVELLCGAPRALPVTVGVTP
ncbi:MAG TPA: hydrogenase maturation protease [Anaeromyxobacter sp.]|nr:hydrogenase maturation protease [Anaeromyxobacter sp.]